MDLESIRTFLVLSSTRNYTQTADQLFVAQSTVTNRINELEKEVNARLFSRSNRLVELTPEGEQFQLYAEKVLKLTENSLAEISSFRKYKNYLRIGSSDSIYEGHLAPIILNYQKKHPEVALKITIGMSGQLLYQLQNNILDVVFSYMPLKKSQYHCMVYKQDNMALVTDVKNTKYKRGITQDELVKENYLMCNFALQDVGQFVRGLFPRYHQFSLEIDDCSKIIPFLLNQTNYTFLPVDMAAPFIRDREIRAIPLKDFSPPVINSYIIGKRSKEKLWSEIFRTKG